MNRVERISFTCFLIMMLLGSSTILLGQTPPPANTLQQGESGNMPTLTAQYGYFYGIPPINVTAQLFGDFGTQDITTLGDVYGDNGVYNTVYSDEYFLGSVNKTDVLAYPVTEASYVIWTDGTTYYAKNGTTGAVTTGTA